MLNEDDRARVAAAVKKAETGLAAELVPVVLAQSSPYPETTWAGGAAGAALACAALFLSDLFHPLWLPLSTLILSVPAAALVGAAIGHRCACVKRLMIGPHRMEAAAARRAKEVFFDRRVDNMKRRDGVLIFASLLERRVVVLADVGVRGKVKPEDWRPALDAFAAAAAEGRTADALIAAVEKAADALRAAGTVR
jgi:putative membrane protein